MCVFGLPIGIAIFAAIDLGLYFGDATATVTTTYRQSWVLHGCRSPAVADLAKGKYSRCGQYYFAPTLER